MHTRLPARDRLELGTVSMMGLGPVLMPSVDAVRRVVWNLAALDPGNRLLRRVDPVHGRLLTVAPSGRRQHLLDVIREFDDDPATIGDPTRDPERIGAWMADRHAEGLGDLPFRFWVGQRYSMLEMSHAVGDAGLFMATWTSLLRRAQDEELPTELIETPVRYPLVRALWRTFGTGVGPTRDLLAQYRTSRRGRRATVSPHGHRHRRDRAGDPRAGSATASRLVSVCATSDTDLSDRVRQWRARNAPTASANGVLYAAAVVALERSALPRRAPGLTVLFDARRYLPDGAAIVGNFVGCVTLTPADSASPQSITTEVRRTISCGRPLASIGAALVTSVVPAQHRPGRADHPHRAPRADLSAGAELTVTSLGDLPLLAHVKPLVTPERMWLQGMVTTSGPDGLTCSFTGLSGAVNVSISFDANRFDPAAVRGIARLLTDDPLALLDARAAGIHDTLNLKSY
ncbi:hypothetical protein MXD61_24790 [Frankia sp. AgPm24]|uniref:hypothetical protein n=1 Tax=Frankia sp. AgPm24 TaxID=631128 RepID=UPI00200E60C9|nr:hypothetical protein [Frankia sp. AgPm24]MCK9925044.1 hypothetical protein [Frankia sp. AgPm24]